MEKFTTIDIHVNVRSTGNAVSPDELDLLETLLPEILREMMQGEEIADAE